MNRRWRWSMLAGLVVVVVAVVAVVAALGGDDEGGASAGGNGEPVTITLMDHQPPRIKLVKRMLPQFEREHPDIKVRLQEGPSTDTDFMTKLTLAYSSGTAPDVVGLPVDPADTAASGYLLDLTDRLAHWADWQKFYPKLRTDMEQQDGKTYTVPMSASIAQLFYRKDVLEKHGISTEQPQSWQELLDRLSQASKALGGPSIVFPAGKAWGAGSYAEGFINLMLGTDSKLYNTASKKWIVRSPGIEQSLGFYVDMTKSGVLDIPPLLNPEPWVPTKYKAFAKGQLAVSTGGSWSWFFDWGKDGAGPIPDLFDKVGVWNYPMPNGGGEYVTGGTGWTWAIAAKSKHPDQAFELLKWLASPKFIAQAAVTVGGVSPRNDVREKPYTDYPVLRETEEQLPKARSQPSAPGSDQISQAIAEVTESIITKRVTTASEAADAFAKRATELLGEDKVEQGAS
jgi:multiple sugar transport system substrate-binding protein